MKDLDSTENKIFINGRFLTQQMSGVQAFAQGVCRELLQEQSNAVILVPNNFNDTNSEFFSSITQSGSLKGHLWEQIQLSGILRKNKNAVLLNLCNTGPLYIKNQVVTIHDLAFKSHKEWFHPMFRIWYNFMVPKLIKNSRSVITVSETIKMELISTYKLKEDKVFVVPNKVDELLLGVNELKPSDDNIKSQEYFLMVGSDDPRKNFAFVESYFAENKTDQKLVIVGSSNRNFGKTVHYQNNNIIRLGFTKGAELKWLYKNAIALINPSLYEGFGIPNLEAMAFECNILCSDIPVFREICKGAARYFNPTRPHSLHEVIADVLKNNMLNESETTEGKVIFTNYQNQNRSIKIKKALLG